MANIRNEGMESRVASITIDRPQAGETLTVAVAPGLRVVLAFNPAAAKFAVQGEDFVLTLEDGAQVVFAGLVSAAQGGEVPTLHVAGIDIDAGVLMEQVLALAEQAQAEPIETAAGEEGEGQEGEASDGGGSHYDDFFGELIAGLIQQGVIGETELGFGLIGSGGTEFLVEAEFLSEGYMPSGGGFGPLGAGSTPDGPGAPGPGPSDPGGPGAPSSLPDVVPVAGGDSGDSGGGDGGVAPDNILVSDMAIITNEANGNLQIPDELILYIADAKNDAADSVGNVSISGPGYDGVNDNAWIWDDTDTDPDLAAPAPFNTWADDGNGHVRFHIQGGGPLYEGSLTYEVTDGSGGTGDGTIGVQNVASARDGSYWTLDRSGIEDGEVLLGLDGRNKITGGDGDDIIHGGHDSSGDILMGGDGNDAIFGGSGNDDLQGGNDDDTFIMRAGFSRDTVDGDGDGDGDIDSDTDTIYLDSVLTGTDVADPGAVANWLTLTSGSFVTDTDTTDGRIELSADASGTIDLDGGNEITFVNIEQIDYTLLG